MLKVAEIVAAQGIRGQVKIKTFTEDPFALGAYKLSDGQGKPVEVTPVSARGHTLIANIAGIDSRDAAENLTGTVLYVAKADLPKLPAGQFYYAELTGFQISLADGSAYGTIKAMHNFGAGDIMEIALSQGKGKTEMLPFSPLYVKKIDKDNKFIIIELLEEIIVRD